MEELAEIVQSFISSITPAAVFEEITIDDIAVAENIDLTFVPTNYDDITYLVRWKDFDVGDATIKLQESLDGVIYEDVTGSSATLSSGTDQFKKTATNNNMITTLRLVYTPGTDTVGEIEGVTIVAKTKFI